MFPFSFEWIWDPAHLVFMGALFFAMNVVGIGMTWCIAKSLNDTFRFLEWGESPTHHVEGVGVIPRDIYKYVSSDPSGDLPRYSIHIVIQHILIFASFTVLAATGLPLHFSDVFWSIELMNLFGGPDIARLIHRGAAFVMAFAALYHILTILIGTIHRIRKKTFDIYQTQIPTHKDLFDLIKDLQYFFGVRAHRPKMDKFMYKQKLHYLAIIWGTSVMLGAGATLLFPEFMVKILPSPDFAVELSRLMHADEAIMAVLVVVFWHWSNVHLAPGRFPFQWAFLTGRITREHQIEEHFLEYLRNLKDLPEEREYMRNLLSEIAAGKVRISDETPETAVPREAESMIPQAKEG